MRPGVTVAIPSVPPRSADLVRAITSVTAQTLPADAISVAIDTLCEGEATTRNRALAAAQTEFTAFLDDDDIFLPEHLSVLVSHQKETNADLCYPWFDVAGGTDPCGWFGREFDPEALRANNYIPVTYLVRTELAKSVGGFPEPDDGPYPSRTACVDWAFLLKLLDAGATFSHVPVKTWIWSHHRANTSGRLWKEVYA